MDISHEKKEIYTLLQKIMKERQELSKQYFELKERLDGISKTKKEHSEIKKNLKKNSM